MPCFSPIPAWLTEDWGVTFSCDQRRIQSQINLPCKKCIGCALQAQKDWGLRIAKEAMLYESHKAWFPTLTYDNEHLHNWNLSVRDTQLFLFKLRNTAKKQNTKIRFASSGEYGEKQNRPHYHMALFGMEIPDLKPWSSTIYTSDLLNKVWGKGEVRIAPFTPGAGHYIAKYLVKSALEDYFKERQLLTDGKKLFRRTPEFMTTSRRPGIGFPWLAKYHKDIDYDGFTIQDGHKIAVPDYFVNKLADGLDPDKAEAIKRSRLKFLMEHPEENEWDRLEVKRTIAEAKRAMNQKSTF